MNETQQKILKEELNIDLNAYKSDLFDKYARIFLEKNSRVNLISKNDEKFLFEKHIFDSLAINLLPSPLALKNFHNCSPSPLAGEGRGEGYQPTCLSHLTSLEGLGVKGYSQAGATLLDIGTGGGFPSIPIAIFYEKLNICALDSIRKKINLIEEIKDELMLENLFPICDRVENIKEKYDYITTRAVASLDVILKYAVPKLKDGGYFIAYKSKKALDEIKEAKRTIRKSGLKLTDIIEYTLPIEEVYERNLIVFRLYS
jgi:16S rRNA (guanine527-N7)-methyltransferase